MNTTQFIELLHGKTLSSPLKIAMDVIERAKLRVVGYDSASPAGDKSCKVYGKVSDGKIFIDDIEYGN